MASSKTSTGVEMNCVRDLPESLEAAVAAGFEFAAVPLFHPRNRRDVGGLSAAAGSPVLPRDVPATRSDLVMDSGKWTTCIVGKLSPWLVLDSPCASLRRESEAALRQELQWAAHLNVPAVLAPYPSGAAPLAGGGPLAGSNYAAHLVQALEAAPSLHLWVRVPLASTPEPPADGEGSDDGAESAARPLAARSRGDPWEGWNALRQHGECHPRLSVALEVTADLPSPAAIARWAGEPIKAAVLPTSIFLTNRAGFPTLSRPHQQLVALLAQYRVQFLLKGRPRVAGGHGAYLQYIAHVADKFGPALAPSFSQPGSTPVSVYVAMAAATAAAAAASAGAAAPASGGGVGGAVGAALDALHDRRISAEDWEALSHYLDVLQTPLQPLADNLESATYETFERDPVKYEQYEAAVAAALRDRPPAGPGVPPVTIWVVGAGRGPLVRRALAAADATGRAVRVLAVEKNPNAVITLKNLCASEASWRGRVTVVSSDMRQLQLATAPTPAASGPAPLHTVVPGYGAAAPSAARGPLTVDAADIIVSELLGSFGDNELSPECLDGVMLRFLKPAPPPLPLPSPAGAFPPLGGISIPSAYTSFLAPVTSHKLWNEARGFGAATREETKWLETAYVVRMWRYHRLGPPQPAFTFSHPGPELAAPDGLPDNRRYVRLSWTMPRAGAGGSDAGSSSSSSGSSGSGGLDPVAGVGHLLHGFGGYFDATLYAPPAAAPASQRQGEVHISTEPHSHTRGMFSWFPLFFPLRQPVYVAPGDVIELHMWRCASASKVWYEWALGSPSVTPVHNPAGRSYAIGL